MKSAMPTGEKSALRVVAQWSRRDLTVPSRAVMVNLGVCRSTKGYEPCHQ
jgi:hypothetical protein